MENCDLNSVFVRKLLISNGRFFPGYVKRLDRFAENWHNLCSSREHPFAPNFESKFFKLIRMPNTKSASKRLRQAEVREARNRSIKTAMKTQIKKVIAAVGEGDIAAAEEQYKLASKKLDRAGSKIIVHKNAAARKKSRLQRLIKKAKQAT